MATKKFFQALADVLGRNAGQLPGVEFDHLVREVGMVLAHANPRFDAGRFEGACLAARRLAIAKEIEAGGS